MSNEEAMDDAERQKLEADFAKLNEEAVSRQKPEEKMRERLAKDTREHARFVAASRGVAHRRFVR